MPNNKKMRVDLIPTTDGVHAFVPAQHLDADEWKETSEENALPVLHTGIDERINLLTDQLNKTNETLDKTKEVVTKLSNLIDNSIQKGGV